MENALVLRNILLNSGLEEAFNIFFNNSDDF